MPQTEKQQHTGLGLLLSPPPLPRQTKRRRENATDKTSAQCVFSVFTCGLTSKLRHARMFVSVLPLLLLFYVEAEGGCGGSSRLLLSVHRARFDFTGTSRDSTAISPRKVKLYTMKGGMSGWAFHNKCASCWDWSITQTFVLQKYIKSNEIKKR